MVLEDDALHVSSWHAQLEAALETAPTPIVSFYLGRLRPPTCLDALDKADANDAHWIVSNHCLHAVALAIRTELVDDMLRALRAYLPIDQAIGRWARQRAHEVAWAPSLVDHADIGSLIRHLDGAPRVPVESLGEPARDRNGIRLLNHLSNGVNVPFFQWL